MGWSCWVCMLNLRMAEKVEKFNQRIVLTDGQNRAINKMLLTYAPKVSEMENIDPETDLVRLVMATQTLNSLKREYGGVRPEVRSGMLDFTLKMGQLEKLKNEFQIGKKRVKAYRSSLGAKGALEATIAKNPKMENNRDVQEELSCYTAVSNFLTKPLEI